MTVIFGRSRHVAIPALAGVRVFSHGGTTAATPWWPVSGKTCVAAYQPKGAASYADSKVNLADSGTYDCADGAAYPSWDTATGWTGNGSTQYLTTGITPSSTWSVLVQFSGFDATQSNQSVLGARVTSSNGFWLAARNDGTGGYTHFYCNYQTRVYVSPSLTSGNLAIAGAKGYLDGSEETSGLTGSASTPPALYILALNNNGSAGQFGKGTVSAVAIYSDTLTDAEIATVAAAMAAL